MKTLLLAGLCSASFMQAQERFHAGQWELAFTGDNPHTSTVCLTPASTNGMNGTAQAVRAHAEKSAAAGKFTLTDYSFDGTTLSMTLTSATRTFTNRSSYHGDTYESLIITKTATGTSTIRTKGRRLGACP